MVYVAIYRNGQQWLISTPFATPADAQSFISSLTRVPDESRVQEIYAPDFYGAMSTILRSLLK